MMLQKFSRCCDCWWRCWFPFSLDVFACGCSWTTPTSATVLSRSVECQNDATKKLNVRSPTRRWVTCTTPCTARRKTNKGSSTAMSVNWKPWKAMPKWWRIQARLTSKMPKGFVQISRRSNSIWRGCIFYLSKAKTMSCRILWIGPTATNNMNEWYHHELEFHSEVYAIRQATRFHLFNGCGLLMRARPIVMHRCSTCVDRRIRENPELDHYQQCYRWWPLRFLTEPPPSFSVSTFAKYNFSYTCLADWNFPAIQCNACQVDWNFPTWWVQFFIQQVDWNFPTWRTQCAEAGWNFPAKWSNGCWRNNSQFLAKTVFPNVNLTPCWHACKDCTHNREAFLPRSVHYTLQCPMLLGSNCPKRALELRPCENRCLDLACRPLETPKDHLT